MIRKTQILSLMVLFFVATTGLPAFIHYCEMMQQKSLSECEMCSTKVEKVVTSCCAEELFNYPVSISSDKPVCCQSKFVFNKVEDEFIYNKSDVTFFSSIEKLIQPITLVSPLLDFSLQESLYCDSSPPFLISPDLNITNSVLLI
jgi:hypothetical protein